MNLSLALQQQRNRESRERWSQYKEHRDAVTELILAEAPALAGGRLCVLGAGNCNDLDLEAIAKTFAQIVLVDWDDEALQTGLTQQPLKESLREKITTLGNIDLTGVAPELSQWSPQSPPDDATIDRWILSSQAADPLAGQGSFDVVISVCTLTQLIEVVILCLGENHPRFVELLVAVRSRHLRMLVELTAPGGTAILCTDIVSSLSCPTLNQIPLPKLAGALSQLIQQRNFFTGANPFVLEAFFRTDPQIASHLSQVILRAPWLWNFGPRHFAVCAIVVRLRADALPE